MILPAPAIEPPSKEKMKDVVERCSKCQDYFLSTPVENRFFSNKCVLGRKEAILRVS